MTPDKENISNLLNSQIKNYFWGFRDCYYLPHSLKLNDFLLFFFCFYGFLLYTCVIVNISSRVTALYRNVIKCFLMFKIPCMDTYKHLMNAMHV